MLILISMTVWCVVLDERLGLWPLPCLAEEVSLLGLHSQPFTARLFSQPTNLYVLVNVILSFDNLMSLDTAHDPISISVPLILTLIDWYLLINHFKKVFKQFSWEKKKSKQSIIIFFIFLKVFINIFSNHSYRTFINFSLLYF